MDNQHQNKSNIVLCGFMGCGKSTIGYRLSQYLNYSFFDTDNYIEKIAAMKITEIFNEFGERHFREYEHQVCEALSKKRKSVIATGGGAVTFSRNVDALKKNGKIVFIDVPLNVLMERLRKSRNIRPLLQKPDADDVALSLFNMRVPIYREVSDFVVNGAQTPFNVVKDIISVIS